jgi:hypothetical protein
MVDWTILSSTFLTAMVEWAGAVVTVLAVGPGRSTAAADDDHWAGIAAYLSLPPPDARHLVSSPPSMETQDDDT